MDIIFQSIDKLLARPHWVDIRYQRFLTNKKLCLFNTTVHSRGVRVAVSVATASSLLGILKAGFLDLRCFFMGKVNRISSKDSICLLVTCVTSYNFMSLYTKNRWVINVMGSPINVGGQYPFITFFTLPRLSGKFLLRCQ